MSFVDDILDIKECGKDKILPDGSNRLTIKERVSKGKGIVRDIVQVLENTYFGEHHFEALRVLRNSMVYSVLTYNLEVSYNLSKSDMKALDKVDLGLIKQVLMTSSKASRSLVLLEMGFMSVEYIIKQKRLNYLFSLIQMEESCIAKNVFLQQLKSPVKGDWIKYVKEDLKELKIELNFEEISSLSRRKWKQIVKESAQKACFNSLLSDKKNLSKGKEIEYDDLVLQPY